MKSKIDTIILCAGKIDYFNLPLKTNTSNSMIPVNGKPVIGWILDDLLQSSVSAQGKIIIVIREEDTFIYEFLNRVYAHRLDMLIVLLKHSESILHSLMAGIQHVQTSGVRVILGDTLIRHEDLKNDGNYIFVQEVNDSSRWCLAVLDDNSVVQYYIEKQANVPAPRIAVCGYYVLSDVIHLKELTQNVIALGKTQISDLLSLYQIKYPVIAIHAEQWYDFGNTDNFFYSKQKLLQGRFFNSLTVDTLFHTITKVSLMDVKLRNELNWYEQLPGSLKVLTPRIISKEIKEGKLHLTQEYYGYPTLSELYLYSNISVGSWRLIFKNLFEIHRHFNAYSGDLSEDDFREIYKVKTLNRLEKTREISAEWAALMNAEIISVNGLEISGLPVMQAAIEKKIEYLVQTAGITIVHGDYCFSNILYDINSHIVRLIDPRGNFGKDGIYGDPRYDIAKLRHSVAGKYDYIVSDLFNLEECDQRFTFEIFARPDSNQILIQFDELLTEYGYNLDDVKWIEALLFLTMIPYHQDKPLRQKAMFLIGILQLNTLL